MGPLGRRYGFAADHLHRLRLVTADGRPHEIDADRAPELFWALRGAGAQRVRRRHRAGVRAVPARPPRTGAGCLARPRRRGRAARCGGNGRRRCPTRPARRWRCCGRRTTPALPAAAARARGPPALHATSAPRRADALLAPMRAVAAPLLDDVRERPVTDDRRRAPRADAPGAGPRRRRGAARAARRGRRRPARRGGLGRRRSPLRPGGAAGDGRRAGRPAAVPVAPTRAANRVRAGRAGAPGVSGAPGARRPRRPRGAGGVRTAAPR